MIDVVNPAGARAPRSPSARLAWLALAVAGAASLVGCKQTKAAAATGAVSSRSAAATAPSPTPASSAGSSSTSSATLTILPAMASLAKLGSVTLATSGGTAPYAWRVVSGSAGTGSVVSLGTGVASYTAPNAVGYATIEVRDAAGRVGTMTAVVPTIPNDTRFATQYGQNNSGQSVNGTGGIADSDIDAPEAWTVFAPDCRSVLVAVIDTGIDGTHPDFVAADSASNLDARGRNFITNTPNYADDNLHGTHVAGIIGAGGGNARGVTGICWKAAVLPVKFLDAAGGGTFSDAIESIQYASSLGAKVINNSWGADIDESPDSLDLRDAIDAAGAAGALSVVAAGNGNASGVGQDIATYRTYPASFARSSMINVAATGNRDELASFSNYSAALVPIAAPGKDILSTFPSSITAEMSAIGKTTAYESISGTSMAAPQVAGALAYLWSAYPSLTAAQARARLLERADRKPSSLGSRIESGRRLNLFNLVDPNWKAP